MRLSVPILAVLRRLAPLPLLAFLLFGAVGASAQPPSARILSSAELQRDFGVMRRALEESHVGLHWHLSPAAYARHAARIEASLARPMDERAFHRLLLPLVASLGHGHTTLDRAVAGEGYRLRRLDRTGRFLLLEVRPIGGRLFVVTDLGAEAAVGAGAEILAVDSVPVDRLLPRLYALLSADGANRTFKEHQLGRGWRFHDLLDLTLGPATRYRLLVRRLGERSAVAVEVDALAPATTAVAYRARTGRGVDDFPPAVAFRPLDRSTALLTVSSLYEGLLAKGSPGFEAEFASAFARIAADRVRHLIVDVRGNEGGNLAVAAMLYSFLADRPFAFAGPSFLSSASLSTLPHVEDPGDEVKAFAADPAAFVDRTADGRWTLKPAFDQDRVATYRPRAEAFRGRLTVLTDGGSFSASNDFVDLVHRHHRRERRPVRFVGQANGGDDAFGFTSGGQMLILLPHSRQRLRLPLLGAPSHFGTARPRAVIPDLHVEAAIADALAGVDPVLDRARATDAARPEPVRR